MDGTQGLAEDEYFIVFYWTCYPHWVRDCSGGCVCPLRSPSIISYYHHIIPQQHHKQHILNTSSVNREHLPRRPMSMKFFFKLIFKKNAPLIGQFFLKNDETMDEDQVELTGLAV